MDEQSFLTANQREILDGSTDLSDESLDEEKTRIRGQARRAVRELATVAESAEIDNSDVFRSDDLTRLLNAIMLPSDGLPPRESFDGDDEYSERYSFQIRLYTSLGNAIDPYGDLLFGTREQDSAPRDLSGK